MKKAKSYRIIFTSTDTLERAEKIAKGLVSQSLAACVNIIPNVISYYKWKEDIEQSYEFILKIKTSKSKLNEIEEFIKQNHSYEVPEILTIKIDKASESYLEWMENSMLL